MLSPCCLADSSLISACERGGRLDRALEWFDRMGDAGVAADGITYRCEHASCCEWPFSRYSPPNIPLRCLLALPTLSKSQALKPALLQRAMVACPTLSM